MKNWKDFSEGEDIFSPFTNKKKTMILINV